MLERKLFLEIRSINIFYPNMENMIVVPTTKGMGIIMGIRVSLISWMNFDCKENGGKKAFPANPKHQYRVSHYGEHDFNANNKRNGECYGHRSLSHFMDEF